MAFPFIILDQNCLRKSDIVASEVERCRQQNLMLMIPDLAAQELSKCLANGTDPFHTWKGSFREIAQYPELVVVGRKLASMMEEERLSGNPCRCIHDNAGTQHLRQHLHELAAGKDSYLRDLIDVDVRQRMPKSLDVWSDHQVQKEKLSHLKETLVTGFSREDISRLRHSPVEGMIEWLTSRTGISHVFHITLASTQDSVHAMQLSMHPSVNAGFVSGLAALALDWFAMGGFEGAKPEDITNDIYDLEYSILASLSHSLISKDKRQNRVYQAIKGGMDGRTRVRTLMTAVDQSSSP